MLRVQLLLEPDAAIVTAQIVRGRAMNAPPAGRGPAGRARAAVIGYFRDLWSGTEPLHRIVISDMLIGGTLVNAVTLVASLALFGLEAPKWLGIAVFLSPIPYNLFIVISVWRTAAASRSGFAWVAQVLSLVWIGCMLLI